MLAIAIHGKAWTQNLEWKVDISIGYISFYLGKCWHQKSEMSFVLP